jgi:hypothetical protein
MTRMELTVDNNDLLAALLVPCYHDLGYSVRAYLCSPSLPYGRASVGNVLVFRKLPRRARQQALGERNLQNDTGAPVRLRFDL